MALPAAVVKLLVKVSAAFLRSFSRRFFSASSDTALALARFCITPLNASLRCFCNAFWRASLFMRFGGDCGKRFGALTVAAFLGFDFGGAGG